MCCFKNNKFNSNVAKHLLENNHICNETNLEILHFERKAQRLTFLEAYEIKKALSECKQLMNEQLDIVDAPLLDILISDLS